MPKRVVTPTGHRQVFEKHVRRLQSNYACLIAVDDEGRSIAKGTAVFVSIGPLKTLVTARHVLRAKKRIGRRLFLLIAPLGPDGLALSGQQVRPILVDVEPQVLWESEALDVAFLRAPQQLTTIAEAIFFDAAVHAEAATDLRKEWREHHTDTTSLPYFIFGFPNFGHLVGEREQRVETLSPTPLIAYVTQYEEYPWDGHGIAPQMLLEADAAEDRLEDADALSAMQKEIVRRFFHPRPDEGEPLGGFSGGPVVYVKGDDRFLIGIIKEGKPLFGTEFRIAASCWDDCLGGFGRAGAPGLC